MKSLFKVFLVILVMPAFFSCREPYIGSPSDNYDQKNDKMPKMADSFVDSIGICMHISYYGTTYDTRWSDVVKPRLLESGIRYMRDDLPTWWNGSTITIDPKKEQRIRSLFDEGGIRLNAVFWARDEDGGHGWANPGPLFTEEQIAGMLLKDNVYEYVVSVEGPNEYNWPSMPYVKPGWADRLRTYLPRLHGAVKNNPALSHLEVIGPSLVLMWDDWNKVEHSDDNYVLGDVSQWVDYGNMHVYPGNNVPSFPVDGEIGKNNVCFPGKPYVITETGHYTLVNGHGLSERADGIHMPRFFLEYFNRGIKRTFKYQFIDENENPSNLDDPENYFGLIDGKGRPKPAFYSIKNIISVLKDPGPDFTPETVNYTITGGDPRIHHTLLQKRDGRLYLCLWSEVPSHDFSKKTDIYYPEQNLTVTLNSIGASSVNIYKNLSSPDMMVTTIGATNVIEVGVNDQVVILEITPGDLDQDGREVLAAGNGVNVNASATSANVTFTGASGLNLTAADFIVSTGGTVTKAVVRDDTVTVTVTFEVNTDIGNTKTYNVGVSPASSLVRGGAIVSITQGVGTIASQEYDCTAANWTVTFEGDGVDCYADFVTNAPQGAPQGGGNAIKLEKKAAVTSKKKLPANFKLEYEFMIGSKSGSAGEMIWFGALPTPAAGPNSLAANHVSAECYGFAPVFFYKKMADQSASSGYGFRASGFGDWELFNNTQVVGNGKSFETDRWHTVEINAINGSFTMKLNGAAAFDFKGTVNPADQYLSFIVGSFDPPSITLFVRNVKF